MNYDDNHLFLLCILIFGCLVIVYVFVLLLHTGTKPAIIYVYAKSGVQNSPGPYGFDVSAVKPAEFSLV